MRKLLPIAAVIPTTGRRERLVKTIGSVLSQEILPVEIVIVDGSPKPWARQELEEELNRPGLDDVLLKLITAETTGAGAQRNQAISCASQPFIWFLDDDVDLQPDCLSSLWAAMQEDRKLGGCNAVIINQHYHPPGKTMRWLLRWTGCPASGSLAGRCVGPGLNFLPSLGFHEDGNEVDWLNTTCTLYRRQALPSPPFLAFFTGYSLMEDLALSLEIGKHWRLRSPASAKIYHDSQPAAYKSDAALRQSMEVANRWFVISRVQERGTVVGFIRMLLYLVIGLAAMMAKPGLWKNVPSWFVGTGKGILRILRKGPDWHGYPREGDHPT